MSAGSLLCLLLDVLSWTWVVAESYDAGKAVKTIAHGDIECLAKDSIALRAVCNDLGVASRDVEYDRISGSGDRATHLDVANAVVDTHKRLLVE